MFGEHPIHINLVGDWLMNTNWTSGDNHIYPYLVLYKLLLLIYHIRIMCCMHFVLYAKKKAINPTKVCLHAPLGCANHLNSFIFTNMYINIYIYIYNISVWNGYTPSYLHACIIMNPGNCYNQWIGLGENLQETIDFPIKYGVFL